MKSFVEKYKPQKTEEIPQSFEELKNLIKNKEHILVYGPTGSGKTTSIYAIAKELDLEIIEVNASDFRTKEQIESIIGSASKQQSLFQKDKILLIDEADCLFGNEDRGGATAIANLLKNSIFPIVLTCNDLYSDKLKDIKKLVNTIEFKPIKSKEIIKILKNICEKEKINFSEEALKNIVINCNGDIRAAINDLQSNTIEKKLQIPQEQRDYEVSIINLLNKIFKTKTFEAHKLLENSNVNLDDYTLWLDENLPVEYKDEDLLKAYETLSKADIFKGRIRRWQHWRLMYYQSLLLSSGISIAKTKINNNFTNYKRSMRPLRIWQFNIKNAKKKSIAEKISAYTHTSKKEVIKNFRYYKTLLKNNEIIKQLKLGEEEIEFVNNMN